MEIHIGTNIDDDDKKKEKEEEPTPDYIKYLLSDETLAKPTQAYTSPA